MKKNYFLLLTLSLLLSGCVCKKRGKKVVKDPAAKSVQIEKHVDIPLASDELKSYFDDQDDLNLGEFVLVEDANVEETSRTDATIDLDTNIDVTGVLGEKDSVDAERAIHLEDADLDDFSWVHELEQADETFKKCHFAFNKYSIKDDQEEKLEKNIQLAKKLIEEGGEPTIVIEGHSCHSAGSMTYNLVLSEKRAKSISDRFVAAGVPAGNIKIVARGQEFPEKDTFGHEVTGTREEQWPNRRGEIHVVYS